MAWTIEYDPRVEQELRKLDSGTRKQILDYMDTRVGVCEDPRAFGKPLRKSLRGLWRYRVRDYRVICEIQDARVAVLVLKIGHRGSVYD